MELGSLLAALWLTGAGLSFHLRDTDGRQHSAEDLRGVKAAVFAFISPDCPISNRSLPELARLHADYAPRGVLFFAVHSDPAVTLISARQHARAFSIRFPVLLDPTRKLAQQTGASATPEFAVVSAAGALLYRGRLDDRTAAFGKTRPAAVHHDLRTALDEILAGKPVARPFTKAIGCAIPFDRHPSGDGVTFARDVAPILYRHCASCHRPGQAAPFSLLTYREAAKRADLIATVTASRYMPPWLPAAGYGKFQDERRLTDAEITTLRRWADLGAPEGDASRGPAPPRFTEGWQLGAPDLVAEMRRSVEIPADGPDRYQCFVLPLALERNRYVRAIEIRPGNGKVVHHALLFEDVTGTARRRDSGDGYECFGTPGFLPARGLGGWTPGGLPLRLPPESAETLYRGADLVVQVHYHPTGKPESDRTAVALYFSGVPPKRRIVDIPLGSSQIDIAPGDRAYKVEDHFTVPVDIAAIGIIPHAHYVCREMKGWALLPDGSRKWLLRIRDWNFDWQEQYRYVNPVLLPAGTRLEMEFTYDNSDANPRNPNHPAQVVRWGPGTRDEMAGLHVQAVVRQPEDFDELGRALWGKMIRSIGGGGYRVAP